MASHRRPKQPSRARVTVLTATAAAAVALTSQAAHADPKPTKSEVKAKRRSRPVGPAAALLGPGQLPGPGLRARPADGQAGRVAPEDPGEAAHPRAAAHGGAGRGRRPGRTRQRGPRVRPWCRRPPGRLHAAGQGVRLRCHRSQRLRLLGSDPVGLRPGRRPDHPHHVHPDQRRCPDRPQRPEAGRPGLLQQHLARRSVRGQQPDPARPEARRRGPLRVDGLHGHLPVRCARLTPDRANHSTPRLRPAPPETTGHRRGGAVPSVRASPAWPLVTG